ncbi:hypothetical protein IAD21_05569 [Abditibacteriota bacterium]|nr:hypothetical protein IAD21_05569 [Abditibacteriota bacterium]
MQVSRLIVGVVLLGAFTRTAMAGSRSEDELSAASVPILAMPSASSRQLVSSGRAVVIADGSPINFQGASLVQVEGRLMVPLRSIGEALGAIVNYDPATGTVSAARAGHRLSLQSGVYILAGRTLVPLRTFSESLGIQVTVTTANGLMAIALNTTENGQQEASIIPQVSRVSPSIPSRGGTANATGDDTTQANIQYNLTQLNALRARAGVSALKLDLGLCEFARQGSLELMRTHVPHNHFSKADVWKNGFERAAAENQGDPHGWFPGPVNQSIDQILQAMMDEGPGGGHHDNILNPAYKRVGIGLVKDDSGRLYFTNDFSG